MDGDDNSLERAFQEYKREESLKAHKEDQKRAKKAKEATAQTATESASKNEGDADTSLEDEKFRNAMVHFKNTTNRNESLRGARVFLEMLDKTNDPEKRASLRKDIWSEIPYELTFRASKAFLLQSIENIDALDGVIELLRQDIMKMQEDGKDENSHVEVRDMMNALNSCEARKHSSLEGRIQYDHKKDLEAVLASKKTHVIAGSVLTISPMKKGLIPEAETSVTLCVSNLPAGITKEAFASYFKRWGHINDIKKNVQLPLPRYNSIAHELHMRCRQLISVLKQSKGEADKTSQKVGKMIALLDSQELDQFFLRKLQAEVILQARELYGADFDEESKTDRVTGQSNRGGSHQKKPCCNGYCGVLGTLCESELCYSGTKWLFKFLEVSLVVLPLLVFLNVGLTTYFIRTSPDTGIPMLNETIVFSLVINGLQMLALMSFAYLGMRMGKFGRDRPVQILWILDCMVLFLVTSMGVFVAEPWDSESTSLRERYTYLTFVQAHALIALIAGVVEASEQLTYLASGLIGCLSCCCPRGSANASRPTKKSNSKKKLNAVQRLRAGFSHFVGSFIHGRCFVISFGTCLRTWRCVTCLKGDLLDICKCKKLRFTQFCKCGDCCEVLYAPGEAGTQAMKDDIIYYCNELNNRMNDSDYTQQNPGLHHLINRMRWRIKRLHLQIHHRRIVEEKRQKRPQEMAPRDDCYACGDPFNWVRTEKHCKHCGYGFCWHCIQNVRRIDVMGYARAHVCDECAKKLAFASERRRAKGLP